MKVKESKQMKKLVIEPVGVCNRIFVLNSALQIAEKCGAELKVLWWNRGCGCGFQDILLAPKGVNIVNNSTFP